MYTQYVSIVLWIKWSVSHIALNIIINWVYNIAMEVSLCIKHIESAVTIVLLCHFYCYTCPLFHYCIAVFISCIVYVVREMCVCVSMFCFLGLNYTHSLLQLRRGAII